MSIFLKVAAIVFVTVVSLGGVGLLIYFLFPLRSTETDDPYLDEFPDVAAPREPDRIGTFTNIRLPVNAVVSRCDAARTAQVLREQTSLKPSSEAAE